MVTLCGLLIYRGAARGLTDDQSQGFGNDYTGFREWGTGEISMFGKFSVAYPFLILVVLAFVAWIFLRKTIWGRYLFALGNNEEATQDNQRDVSRRITEPRGGRRQAVLKKAET